MSGRTILWTLVAFFGASIAFRAVRVATEDEPAWISLGAGLLVLAAIVGLIVVLARRRG